jgi:ubiquitin related modifier 1
VILTNVNSPFHSFPPLPWPLTLEKMAALELKVEFGGGLELLFSNQRKHLIDIPSTVPRGEREGQPADIDFLIYWLKDNLLKERPELFIENGSLWVVSNFARVIRTLIPMGSGCRRPGILVLVNDTDWELEGEGGYELKGDDEIVFISTLHGG